jgi:hypothetical protein
VKRPAEIRRCYYILRQQQQEKNNNNFNGPLCCFFFHLETTQPVNMGTFISKKKTQHTDVIKSIHTAKAIEHRDVEYDMAQIKQ